MGGLLTTPKTEKQKSDGFITITDNTANTANTATAANVSNSNLTLQYGSCCMQGWRKHQEDAVSINYYNEGLDSNPVSASASASAAAAVTAAPGELNTSQLVTTVNKGYFIFSIFDGHGGFDTSQYCESHFNSFLMNKIRQKQYKITKKTILQAFHEFDQLLPSAASASAANTAESKSAAIHSNSQPDSDSDADADADTGSTNSKINNNRSKRRRRRPIANNNNPVQLTLDLNEDGDEDADDNDDNDNLSNSTNTPLHQHSSYFSSSNTPHTSTGSTASICIVDLNQRKIYIAHLGDSRVLVFKTNIKQHQQQQQQQHNPLSRSDSILTVASGDETDNELKQHYNNNGFNNNNNNNSASIRNRTLSRLPGTGSVTAAGAGAGGELHRRSSSFSSTSSVTVRRSNSLTSNGSINNPSRSASVDRNNPYYLLYASRDHNPDDPIESNRLHEIIQLNQQQAAAELLQEQQAKIGKRQRPIKSLTKASAASVRKSIPSHSIDSDSDSDSSPDTALDHYSYNHSHINPASFKLIDSRIYTFDCSSSLNVCRGFGDRNFKHTMKNTNKNKSIANNRQAVSTEPDFYELELDSINTVNTINSGNGQNKSTNNNNKSKPNLVNNAPALTADPSDSTVLCIYLASDGVWNSNFPESTGLQSIVDPTALINEQIMQWTVRHTIVEANQPKLPITVPSTPVQPNNHSHSNLHSKTPITASTASINSNPRSGSGSRTPTIHNQQQHPHHQNRHLKRSSSLSGTGSESITTDLIDDPLSPSSSLVRADTVRLDDSENLAAAASNSDYGPSNLYSSSIARSFELIMAKPPVNKNNAKQTDNMTAILITITIPNQSTATATATDTTIHSVIDSVATTPVKSAIHSPPTPSRLIRSTATAAGYIALADELLLTQTDEDEEINSADVDADVDSEIAFNPPLITNQIPDMVPDSTRKLRKRFRAQSIESTDENTSTSCSQSTDLSNTTESTTATTATPTKRLRAAKTTTTVSTPVPAPAPAPSINNNTPRSTRSSARKANQNSINTITAAPTLKSARRATNRTPKAKAKVVTPAASASAAAAATVSVTPTRSRGRPTQSRSKPEERVLTRSRTGSNNLNLYLSLIDTQNSIRNHHGNTAIDRLILEYKLNKRIPKKKIPFDLL